MAVQYTIVSEEVIQEADRLIVAYSDGSMADYTCWMKLTDAELRQCRYKTHEEIVEFCRDKNCEHRHNCNYALHMRKVETLGWDYAKRGY